MLTFKNYNIADWLSFFRVAIAPFLLLLIWLDHRMIFAWLLLLSYSTDALDGFLARKLQISSPRGSQLDSFGDQVTFAVGVLGLFYFEKAFILKNLVLILVVFIPYIIQMILAYMKYGKASAFHTYLAKISAVIQSIFILYSLFFQPEYALFYVMIVVGLLETIEEITLIFMHRNWASDVKGIYWALRKKRQRKKTRKK